MLWIVSHDEWGSSWRGIIERLQQIKAWKDACINANGGVAKEAARLNRELKNSEKERKKLERELQRKEKALAEAAALLVLSKKANAIWGDPEDE